jgi:hypothetical protein
MIDIAFVHVAADAAADGLDDLSGGRFDHV